MAYTDAMNYGSMYGQSAYPYQLPQTTQNPGVSGAYMPGMDPMTGQVVQAGVQPPGQANSQGYQTPQLTGWQKFGYVMDAIGTIGGLWGAIQQNKIAKQQLALSKEAYNTNMNNTIKTYNTALEDRIRARYEMEGRAAEADGYIERNKLSRS